MKQPTLVKLTKEQQLMALKLVVPEYALGEKKPGVAGGQDWTPHEWVMYALDVIFGPDGWSDRIVGSITPMTAPDGEMYIYIPIELTVTFADGTQATRTDVGVGNVRFTRDAKQRGDSDLAATPLDNFSTGYKSAITSGLKGCCRDLGRIFVPLQYTPVANAIKTEMLEREITHLFSQPVPDYDPQKILSEGKRLLGRDDGDLTGANPGNGNESSGPEIAALAAHESDSPVPAWPQNKRDFGTWALNMNYTGAEMNHALGESPAEWTLHNKGGWEAVAKELAALLVKPNGG